MNEKSSGSRSRKQRLTAVGTSCADHVTPLYPQKFALTSPTGGGRSVGIVRVRTKATEFRLVVVVLVAAATEITKYRIFLGSSVFMFFLVDLRTFCRLKCFYLLTGDFLCLSLLINTLAKHICNPQ